VVRVAEIPLEANGESPRLPVPRRIRLWHRLGPSPRHGAHGAGARATQDMSVAAARRRW